MDSGRTRSGAERLGCIVGTGDPICDASDVNCDGIVGPADLRIIQCQSGQMAPGDPACCECDCDGDVDGSGLIDQADLAIVIGRIGCNVLGSDPLCLASDVNCDGVVNQTDAAVVGCMLGQMAPGDPACCDACACDSDVDGSGVIDLADVAAIVGQVGCPVGTGIAACDRADVNCDGVVDEADVRIARCQLFQMAPGDPSCCDCVCDGDVNGNGIIDANDVIIAQSRFGCVPFTGDPVCDASDVNCDGVVDQNDIAVIQCQLGQMAPGDPACCEVCDCDGDADGSGMIDAADLNLVSTLQGCPVGTGDPVCDAADVNCDGVVDLRDVRVVECQFGQMAPGDPACCDVCACNGDHNRDGVIDLVDFQQVSNLLGCPVGAGDPDCDRADINCDGFVDQRDLDVIQCQFGQLAPGDVTCCDVCSCTGDVDRDGDVDAFDINTITASQGCPVGTGDPLCDRSDVNCDGVVDVYDVAIATCQLGPGQGDPRWCADEPGACCFGCDGYPGGASFLCRDLSRVDCAFAQGLWAGPTTSCADFSCEDRLCRHDLNGDGVVNIFDFNTVTANFGTSNPTPGRCLGDCNCDGLVNIFDYNAVTGQFGCPQGPPFPLPDQCCLSLPSP